MAEAFEITGGDQLSALAGRLGRVPAAMRTQTVARMQAVGEQMKTAVQRNALAIPVKGEETTGLRHAIAAATKVRTRVSPRSVDVRVAVDSTAMPPGQEKLPALMESAGWTHPTFGSRPAQVFQPGHLYFHPAIEPLLPLMQSAIDSAAADATRAV